MLYYEKIDISEGIDLTKSNKNKECMIFRYLFFNHGFKFEDSIRIGCHGLTMLSGNVSDFAIMNVKDVDYCCNIHKTSKSEEIYLSKNYVLDNCGYIYKY